MGSIPKKIELKFQKAIDGFRQLVESNGSQMNEFHYHSRYYVHGIIRDLELFKRYADGAGSVLDVGCGSGMITSLVSTMARYCVGIDMEEGKDVFNVFKREVTFQTRLWQVLQKTHRVGFLFYDGRELPFQKKTFDAVVLYAVLEHIEADDLPVFLKEAWRVLKDDGTLFIARTPRRLAYLEHLAGILRLGRHDKLYGDVEIVQLLSAYGFDIIHKDCTDMLFSSPPFHHMTSLYNAFFGGEVLLDRFLMKSPAKLFSHNLRVVAKKR